jgi:1,3-beta-glucanosyltransferase GAS1
MNAYNPTNSPAACPGTSNIWAASNSLPPTPDEATCQCMYASLSCVPSSRLSVKAYGELFGNICGQPGKPCAGISGDVTSGIFGAYSMCNSTQQLGFALDSYYQSQGSKQGACDWDGQATIVQPVAAQGDCVAKLNSASASNSFAATATAAPNQSKNAAAGGRMPGSGNWGVGDALVGLYVLGAMAVGAGMVML